MNTRGLTHGVIVDVGTDPTVLGITGSVLVIDGGRSPT
jgi:hypothetical protein